MMSWLLITVFLLGLSLSSLEANYLQSTVVVGSVYCDTCFNNRLSKTGHFIPGATVAVQCIDENAKRSFYEEVTTDEHGEFRVLLPFYVAPHVRKIEGCSVKWINSGEPFCSVPTMGASPLLRLTLKMPDAHVFSAGNFMFKPLTQPALCSKEQGLDYREFSSPKPGFIPPIFGPWTTEPKNPNMHPAVNLVTPVPLLPWLPLMPQVPQTPVIPKVPNPTPRPSHRDSISEVPSYETEFFGPRFDQFPPVTLQQPLLPTLPEPEDPFTLIPNLTPPLAIPAFHAPIPAFPFPFAPRFPGFPAAKRSAKTKNSP
ncbi:hypothetical protein MLD38_013156 [Melastoma candidum]|uniref:Uncharacterized protein n=1 Tax=Melastoma candidum TaxID=119954 RepID=A0ACB9RAI7_9MYRT|nr:hypothetical protein MLD38_013156 [Melastoma candidum]